MSNILLFLEKQRRDLLRDFTEGNSCFIALSIADLAWGQEEEGWRIDSLPGRAQANAFVIQKRRDLPTECWVRWNYSRSRDAFQVFLTRYFSEYDLALDKSVQVDHLLPKCRFKIGAPYFVRLHLVIRNVNASHGAGLERDFYPKESEKEPCGAIRMSWITYCKAQGICLPGKNAGALALRAWAHEQGSKFSRESGENPLLTCHVFLSVLHLGYTGRYSGDQDHS